MIKVWGWPQWAMVAAIALRAGCAVHQMRGWDPGAELWAVIGWVVIASIMWMGGFWG